MTRLLQSLGNSHVDFCLVLRFSGNYHGSGDLGEVLSPNGVEIIPKYGLEVDV